VENSFTYVETTLSIISSIRCAAWAQIKALRESERGGAAVEFALIAPIFLSLICVTVEVSLSLMTESALATAAHNASRLILTGQIQTGGGSATPFTNQLCANVSTLVSCASLQYNVQSGSSFGALNGTIQTDSNGNMTNTHFTPGGPGQDVLVQVAYNRPFIIPWVGTLLGNSNSMLLVASVAFQNDPYQ
jgi:Flp pilus assembly protein TadG